MLDTGWIDLLKREDISTVLENLKNKNHYEARALLLTLYMTGARPSEVLELRSKQVIKEGQFLQFKFDTKKHGRPRVLMFSYRDAFIKEIWEYTSKLMPDMLLFVHFRNRYIRVRGEKVYEENTGKLGYYFKRWFKCIENPINPYFLRHNRHSQLSQGGATLEELMWYKGSKSVSSVIPYIHQSQDIAKKLAKRVL